MSDVLAVRDEYRAQTWAMLIQECNYSGLTKKNEYGSILAIEMNSYCVRV